MNLMEANKHFKTSIGSLSNGTVTVLSKYLVLYALFTLLTLLLKCLHTIYWVNHSATISETSVWLQQINVQEVKLQSSVFDEYKSVVLLLLDNSLTSTFEALLYPSIGIGIDQLLLTRHGTGLLN